MSLTLFVTILIIVFSTLFFIIGLTFAIYIVFNKFTKDIDELSDEEKEIVEKTISENTNKKKFEHIYFL